jgi:1,4-alpha-glucan branching enzyme
MTESPQSNPVAPKAPWRTIYFRLDAPEARHVSVVGDFNAWDREKHPLRQDANGVWVCQMPLPAGHYAYCFLVDGVCRPDPQCVQQVHTESGQVHCVIEVSAPSEQ